MVFWPAKLDKLVTHLCRKFFKRASVLFEDNSFGEDTTSVGVDVVVLSPVASIPLSPWIYRDFWCARQDILGSMCDPSAYFAFVFTWIQNAKVLALWYFLKLNLNLIEWIFIRPRNIFQISISWWNIAEAKWLVLMWLVVNIMNICCIAMKYFIQWTLSLLLTASEWESWQIDLEENLVAHSTAYLVALVLEQLPTD